MPAPVQTGVAASVVGVGRGTRPVFDAMDRARAWSDAGGATTGMQYYGQITDAVIIP